MSNGDVIKEGKLPPGVYPAYVDAFRQVAKRIEGALKGVSKKSLPVRMYVAGGAAIHFRRQNLGGYRRGVFKAYGATAERP